MERFPKEFRFQLTDFEKNELVTNCDRFKVANCDLERKRERQEYKIFALRFYRARGKYVFGKNPK